MGLESSRPLQHSLMSTEDVLRRAAPIIMSASELACSVCHELPPDQVHQCSRGHFLCVSCWNDIDRMEKRICPQCRVPLPFANRNRVAELVIKNLPRPDGYTTPPPVRPSNRGDALTPLLEGEQVRKLEQEIDALVEKLGIAEATVASQGERIDIHEAQIASHEVRLASHEVQIASMKAEATAKWREADEKLRVLEEAQALEDKLQEEQTAKIASLEKDLVASLKSARKERDEMKARLAALGRDTSTSTRRFWRLRR